VSSERSLITGCPETDLWEALESGFHVQGKVKSRSPNPQLLIALHSPKGLRETGPRMCLLEKSQDSTAFDAEQSVLRSPVCLGIIAKYGHYSRISAQSERNFSAVKTCWRSEWDSILHYLFESRNSLLFFRSGGQLASRFFSAEKFPLSRRIR
jgi:hypothetical protein